MPHAETQSGREHRRRRSGKLQKSRADYRDPIIANHQGKNQIIEGPLGAQQTLGLIRESYSGVRSGVNRERCCIKPIKPKVSMFNAIVILGLSAIVMAMSLIAAWLGARL